MIIFDLYNVKSGGGIVQAKIMLANCYEENIIIVADNCDWIDKHKYENSIIKKLSFFQLLFFRLKLLIGLNEDKDIIYINPSGNWGSLRYKSYLLLQNMLYVLTRHLAMKHLAEKKRFLFFL